MYKTLNNYFNLLSVGEALFKSKADIYNKNIELLLLYEERLELLLIKLFNDSKKDVLDKISIIDKYVAKKFISQHVSELIKYPLEPRYKFTQVGNTRFKEFTFSVQIRDWLIKSGMNDDINAVVLINPDPFKTALTDAQFQSYTAGGQTVFNVFDVNIDFALRDKNVEKFYENYSIKLSHQVARELQTKIKFEILEGIKNAESIPKIRNRILNVYNKPIDVVVKPKLNASGEIIRQGYTYQMSPVHWANTTARTEVMNAYTAGRLEGFKISGVIDSVQYSTSPDERLCPVCAPLEGVVYKLQDADGVIPQHANCRCQWIPLINGDYAEAREKAQQNISDAYSSNLYEYGKNKKHFVDDYENDLYIQTENPNAGERVKKIMDEFFGKRVSSGDIEKAFSIDVPGYSVELNKYKMLKQLVEMHNNSAKDSFQIVGEIVTEDGKGVGMFFRDISKSQKKVKHSFFELKKPAQGKGISKSLLENSVSFYDYLGLEKISVQADLDVGKYAWSKYGFDFDSAELLRNYRKQFISNFEYTLENKLVKKGFTYGDASEIWSGIQEDIIKEFNKFKHSWDFALFKQKFNIRGVNIEIAGRELMLDGISWNGSLYLDKNSISRKIFDDYIKGK